MKDFGVPTWTGTKRSLHLYAQMLGKVRVALSPPQPNWMFTALYLTARGLSTGAIPIGEHSCEVRLDVFDSKIDVLHSNGSSKTLGLVPVRTVAEVYADLTGALDALQIPCTISTIPQEVPDVTPLDSDRRPSEYDPAAAQLWFATATAVAGIFERWRSRFFGRSGIQLWWGAFDISLMLFSGKHVKPPADRGYLLKYDLDAELVNIGLYFGDEKTAPFFYGYIFPEPKDAATCVLGPRDASWSTQLREWVLPYEAVRASSDPEATLCAFIDAIYEQCFLSAGWDRAAFSYDAPKRRLGR